MAGAARFALALAMVLTMATVGVVVATVDGPDRAASSSVRAVDLAFAVDLIPHARAAIAFSDLAAKRGRDPAVRELARSIAAEERDMLSRLRESSEKVFGTGADRLGQLPREDTEEFNLYKLRRARPIDPVWVEIMIPHRLSSIGRAQTEAGETRDANLRLVAEDMARRQQAQVEALRALRRELRS
jgi:hypothetical protein